MKGFPPHVRGVILDTNMFLVPYQFGVDVLEEISRILPGVPVYTIPQVIKELERIEREGDLHERLGARIGKMLLDRIDVLEVDPRTPTDRMLLEMAERGYVVATNDGELRKRIREVGGYTIYLREKNHLEMG